MKRYMLSTNTGNSTHARDDLSSVSLSSSSAAFHAATITDILVNASKRELQLIGESLSSLQNHAHIRAVVAAAISAVTATPTALTPSSSSSNRDMKNDNKSNSNSTSMIMTAPNTRGWQSLPQSLLGYICQWLVTPTLNNCNGATATTLPNMAMILADPLSSISAMEHVCRHWKAASLSGHTHHTVHLSSSHINASASSVFGAAVAMPMDTGYTGTINGVTNLMINNDDKARIVMREGIKLRGALRQLLHYFTMMGTATRLARLRHLLVDDTFAAAFIHLLRQQSQPASSSLSSSPLSSSSIHASGMMMPSLRGIQSLQLICSPSSASVYHATASYVESSGAFTVITHDVYNHILRALPSLTALSLVAQFMPHASPPGEIDSNGQEIKTAAGHDIAVAAGAFGGATTEFALGDRSGSGSGSWGAATHLRSLTLRPMNRVAIRLPLCITQLTSLAIVGSMSQLLLSRQLVASFATRHTINVLTNATLQTNRVAFSDPFAVAEPTPDEPSNAIAAIHRLCGHVSGTGNGNGKPVVGAMNSWPLQSLCFTADVAYSQRSQSSPLSDALVYPLLSLNINPTTLRDLHLECGVTPEDVHTYIGARFTALTRLELGPWKLMSAPNHQLYRPPLRRHTPATPAAAASSRATRSSKSKSKSSAAAKVAALLPAEMQAANDDDRMVANVIRAITTIMTAAPGLRSLTIHWLPRLEPLYDVLQPLHTLALVHSYYYPNNTIDVYNIVRSLPSLTTYDLRAITTNEVHYMAPTDGGRLFTGDDIIALRKSRYRRPRGA